MSVLKLNAKDHAHEVLQALASAEHGEVEPTDYILKMQAREVTAEEAVSVLQEMIADGELVLTNSYLVRVR
ncbi:hypothetical protein QE394_000733 [Arthrobacter sp. SORGH_AS 212]|nr:hypothetical protein [Arthrobacter sp. SORGH_AS_0212]